MVYIGRCTRVVRERDSDTLCIVINHMVCDGSGFKEYLYLLAQLYTSCKNNFKRLPSQDSASRSAGQLFDGFNLTDKLGILRSKYDLSKQKQQAAYRLQGDKNNPLFTTLHITREGFESVKAYAKNQGVTVNDLILAAYVRVLHRETGSERIIVPCPVDLRKYLNPNRKPGICNLTGNYICDIVIGENDSFEQTLSQVAHQMGLQKSSKNCLKPVLMLDLACRVLPFGIMQKVFRKTFTIPVISFTNLGVIDKNRLRFDKQEITEAYLTGTVKYVPYFQLAVSTYDDVCTLSCNLYGTPNDKIQIEYFLMEVKKELIG